MADHTPSSRWLLWALLAVAGGSVALYWILGEANDTWAGILAVVTPAFAIGFLGFDRLLARGRTAR